MEKVVSVGQREHAFFTILLLLLRCVAQKFLFSGLNLIGVNDVLWVIVNFHRFHLDHGLRRDANHRMMRCHGVVTSAASSATTAATAVVSLRFGVGQNVRFEIGRLSELFITSIEGTNIRPITGVYPHVSPKVKIQRESLAATFEGTLEWFLAGVHQLVPFQLGALHKGLSAFCTNVHPRAMSMQVFSHRRIISEHFVATFMRTGDISVR